MNDEGAKAAAQATEVRFPHANPTSDEEIWQRAMKALARDLGTPCDRVQVKVQRGWVTLSGEVNLFCERQAAGHAIRKLPGVSGVSNLIATAFPRP